MRITTGMENGNGLAKMEYATPLKHISKENYQEKLIITQLTVKLLLKDSMKITESLKMGLDRNGRDS